jgi:2-polyprenyl-6-methoxyphenol hydroxylase-like FAD-dependent oxidoreductase
LIGDATHVMLPVGGVGITMAIQDAVATANLLVPPLRRGQVRMRDLAAVQRRREWPTRMVQAVQRGMQRQLLTAGQFESVDPLSMSVAWRLAHRRAMFPALVARVLAYGGFWPKHARPAMLSSQAYVFRRGRALL